MSLGMVVGSARGDAAVQTFRSVGKDWKNKVEPIGAAGVIDQSVRLWLGSGWKRAGASRPLWRFWPLAMCHVPARPDAAFLAPTETMCPAGATAVATGIAAWLPLFCAGQLDDIIPGPILRIGLPKLAGDSL